MLLFNVFLLQTKTVLPSSYKRHVATDTFHVILINFCVFLLFFHQVCAEYADVTYFRDLNWIFPVKAKSIFKITVASRDKEVGSTKVDLHHLKSIPFDHVGNREVRACFFLVRREHIMFVIVRDVSNELSHLEDTQFTLL